MSENGGSTTQPRQYPQYQSHKTVGVLKIWAVQYSSPPQLLPCDQDYPPIEVSQEWLKRHQPQAGGYFVVYENGYASYTPAIAFENGYTRVQ